jgi:hypothetical protein
MKINSFIVSICLFSFISASVQLEALQKRKNEKSTKTNSQESGEKITCLAGNHFTTTAELLYWQASEGHLSYGNFVKGLAPFAEVVIGRVFQEELNLNFEWNPGFRLGLGYQFAEADDWDLYFNYTYMYSTAQGSKAGDFSARDVIFPSWDTFFLGLYAIDARAKWNVNYNVLDGEIGKNYLIGTRLEARPFLGLRGATIHQHYKAEYDSFFNGKTSTFKAKNKFDGIGIRAGTDLLWHFTKNWSLCGQLSGALLYGRFDVNQKVDGFLPSDEPDPFKEILSGMKSRDFWQPATTVQAAIGFSWEKAFKEKKQHLTLSLMYEINEWFKQNQFFVMQNTIAGNKGGDQVPILKGTSTDGDLGFQGVTLRAQFDF